MEVQRGKKMDDVISRQQAIDAAMQDVSSIRTHEFNAGATRAANRIKQLPSAQPKRGKWRHYEGVLTCSECASEFYDTIMEFCGDDVPHFCPNCGADMRTKETNCNYERAVEQLEHDMLYEPTFNQDDGSM